MDGAFFQPAVIDALEHEGVEYAIKAPFSSWLELREPNGQTPPLGTCGRDGEVFGSVALGACMVKRHACRAVPQACASPDTEEPSTESLRP